MKVITLKQPWATLVASGYKQYEFRSWQTKYRGPLLIHAGKGVDKQALKRVADLNLEYPVSQIIAMVQLDDCILVNDEFNNQLLKDNQKAYGANDKTGLYAWKLSHIKRLTSSEKVNGKLGLWNFETQKNL